MAKILDVDHVTGITETFKQDAMTGIIEINKFQDTSKIFDANARDMNAQISNNWSGEMHKVASIPLIVIDMWREELKKQGASDCNPLAKCNKTFLIAKINSSEWSKIRTKQGRI
jgi:hypothetical protein